MESILSIQEDIYPLKSRGKRSATHLANNLHVKTNLFSTQHSSTRTFCLFYRSMKTIFVQRSLYILGIFNLCLAAVAIVCVTHAEDHPEYFALVYIAVSIFIFYMATIVFIIILQIVETYREQEQKQQQQQEDDNENQSTTVVEHRSITPIPLMVKNSRPKTRLSRSQTLPLKFLSVKHPEHALSLSTSTSSIGLKDSHPNSMQQGLLPRSYQTLSKNSQTFAFPSTTALRPFSRTLTTGDTDPQLSPLIKPIPLKFSSSRDRHRTKFQHRHS